jgi:hypothetical protein
MHHRESDPVQPIRAPTKVAGTGALPKALVEAVLGGQSPAPIPARSFDALEPDALRS